MAVFRYPQTQTTITGGATEAKQDAIIAELQDIDTNTATNATETTLSALNTKVTAVDTGNVTVSSSALPTGAATETTLDTLNTNAANILLDTGSLDTKITACNTGDVTVSSSALPTGAATETTLSALNTKVTAVNTGDVTVSSSALPTGAATSANQTTANSSLSNIESDINNLEARLAGSLVPEAYDYIAITYVAAGNGIGEVETATYKTGGAAGSTVATLTLAYDANDKLASVTKA